MFHRLIVVADHKNASLIHAHGRKLNSSIRSLTNAHDVDNEKHKSHQRQKQHISFSSHAPDLKSNLKESAGNAFAKDICAEIQQALIEKSYDSLVLVCAPKMLGKLRKQLKSQSGFPPLEKELSVEACNMEHDMIESKIFE